jgi:L-fucose isomerase-like protein
MTPITIKTLAHAGAAERLHDDALQNLQLLFGIEEYQVDDHPRVLYFLTGGSEAQAIQCLKKDKFQLLVASGKTNALASALEVKAYSNQHGYRNVLLCVDDAKDKEIFLEYIAVFTALDALQGKRLGLIGEVSDWLVASSIDAKLLKEKLGIELIQIPWNDVGDFHDFEAGRDFLECYHAGRQYNIEDAGKVNSLLKKVIEDHHLDAITVECFSLVMEKNVTACLGLSFLNDLGIPAGCEGDLCSIIGLMIAKELTGALPWMANIAGISGNDVLFAHCTAPTSVLSEYHINTHFETGKGTAIHGRYKEREVSIFRLNNSLDKVFHAYGEVVDGIYHKNACRTQLHVVLDETTIDEIKSRPLGNHHLILAGDHREKLGLLKEILNIE